MATPVSRFITEKKSEANKYLKKLTFGSTYETFHGSIRKPTDAPCDADILKYRRFGELEYTGYLQPLMVQYIQNWTRLEDDSMYKSLVLVTVRNMYTYIKGLIPSDTMHHKLFFWPKKHQLYTQEKIKNGDDVVRAVTQQSNRGGWSEYNSGYEHVAKEIDQFEHPKPKIITSKTPLSLTAFNPADVRQQLVRGSGNVIAGGYTRETGETIYGKSYKNPLKSGSKMLGRSTSQIDLTQSYSLGVIVPDPITIKRIQERERFNRTPGGYNTGIPRTTQSVISGTSSGKVKLGMGINLLSNGSKQAVMGSQKTRAANI